MRSSFLSESTVNVAINHPDIYKKVAENALILSKIYAHQGKNKGVSTVDLLLAARVMFYEDRSLLITGNIKHFPFTVFGLIDVINVPQKDGHVKVYGVLQFNLDSFTQNYESMPN